MHILITTAGVLPPEPVANFAEILAGSGGGVTVMNVIQTPHDFLQELDADDWLPFDTSKGDPTDPHTSSEAERYVRERGSKMIAPVVAALKSRNIDPDTVFVEADDVADAIIDTAERIDADVIMLGATRRLFAETAWTSISMKVTTASKVPILLVPEPTNRYRPGVGAPRGDR